MGFFAVYGALTLAAEVGTMIERQYKSHKEEKEKKSFLASKGLDESKYPLSSKAAWEREKKRRARK